MIITLNEADGLIKNYVEQVSRLLGGNGYSKKILCPFHEDKNASLKLYINSMGKLVGYCFACGKTYRVGEIYAKQHGMSITDAYREIMEKLNLTQYTVIDSIDNTALIQAIKKVHDLILTRELTEEAEEFFNKKGINKATLLEHNICQLDQKVPKNDIITRVAKKYDVHSEFLIDTFSPVWGNRIVYPICDSLGNICAYASRTLDKPEPKYINSKTTPLYNKGKMLYGLNVIDKVKGKIDKVFIVEGYNDALAMWQNGYKNTVALGGTSLTKNMVQLLKDFTTIILMFDNDEAGLEATANALLTIIPESKDCTLKLLPKGQDIDEYLASNKNSLVLNQLKEIDGFTFILKAITSKEILYDVMKNSDIDYLERNILQTKVTDDVKYKLLYSVLKLKYDALRQNILNLVR